MRFSFVGLAIFALTSSAFAANVRTDRPRMLLGNGTGLGTTAAMFKDRCTNDANYAQRCTAALAAGGGLYPAINDAAGFVVNGDAARCTKAYVTLQTIASDVPGQPDPHSFISNNGRTMLQLAVVRDWCDAQLTTPQKTWIEGQLTAYGDWVLSGMSGYALDVYHDDMNNVWSSVALAGLTLKGTSQDTKATTYLGAADDQWKKIIFPALAYEGDFWHEGFTYVQPSIASAAVHALSWSIATDENLFTYTKQNANGLYEGYIDFHAYVTRPDYNYAYFGDTTDNKQSIQLFTRPLIDMLTLGTGSTLGQAFSDEIKANTPAAYDYAGADAYLLALFYDASKDGAATPRSTLPTSRWLSRGAADVVVMRSGWGKSGTFVYVSCVIISVPINTTKRASSKSSRTRSSPGRLATTTISRRITGTIIIRSTPSTRIRLPFINRVNFSLRSRRFKMARLPTSTMADKDRCAATRAEPHFRIPICRLTRVTRQPRRSSTPAT